MLALGAPPAGPLSRQPSVGPATGAVPGVTAGAVPGAAVGAALGRGTGGCFDELGADGSMTILLDTGAELGGDVRGSGIDWLSGFGDLLREISTAMTELTRMAKITPAVRSAVRLARLRCRPAEVRNGVIPQRLPVRGAGPLAGPQTAGRGR